MHFHCTFTIHLHSMTICIIEKVKMIFFLSYPIDLITNELNTCSTLPPKWVLLQQIHPKVYYTRRHQPLISHIMYWNHHDGAYGRCCGALMPTVDPNAATAAKADGSTTHISKVHFLFPLLSVSKSYRATITIHCLKYSHTLWRLCWLAKVLAATIALAHSS